MFLDRLNEHAKGLELHMGAEKYLYCINELDFKTKHSVQKLEKSQRSNKKKIYGKLQNLSGFNLHIGF